MIMYILFVPPAEREELLEGRPSVEDPDDPHPDRLVRTLIDEEPGKLVRSPTEDFEYSLPSFTLRESTYSSVLLDENPFIVRRSWFADSSRHFEFSLPSVSDTVRVLLTFEVGHAPEGDLEILLNGQEVFQGMLGEGPIKPLELPLGYLRDSNTLTLRSSLPGFRFWSSNAYRISGLTLAGDFYNPDDLESSHTFFIEDKDVENLDSARMTFSASCDRETVGKLSITMNGQSIFSSIPDCNTLNRVNFNPDMLERENTVNFVSTGGDYTISLGKIMARLGDIENPRYNFELSRDDYRDLEAGRKQLRVYLDLQDDERFKQAYVLVNSVRYFLDTRDNRFEETIRHEVLREGRNSVEIMPLNDFDAIGMKVNLYRR